MRVSIISLTNETISCIRRFSQEIVVFSVAEKDYRLWENTISKLGCIITSVDAAIIAYRNHQFDKFIIPCLLKGNVLSTMYVFLKSYDIPDDDILYVPYHVIKDNNPILPDRLCKFIERRELDRLELHINDHCNLRCSNCSMLAGLVHDITNADVELTRQSLLKLRSVFSHIIEIDIFGGEPLLNPNLKMYCGFLRELFPDAVIFIVTNGIKLCTLNHDILRSIQTNHIQLSITYYPIFDEYIEQAMQLCQEWSISFVILQKRVNFLNLYDFSGEQNADEVFHLCKRRLSIVAMRENKLASCYTPFAFCYAEKQFKIGYKETGIVDILSEELTPSDIITRFMQPMDCCRFCHCDKSKWYQIGNQSINETDWSK